MSVGAVSGMVQNGLLAQLVGDSTATKAQLDKLTQQSASGQVADTYGGLGEAASVSIDLRPQMAQVQAWQQSISAANGTLDTTQTVLGQLQSIASSFASQALGTPMQSATGAAAMAAQAQSALQQVVALLNTQTERAIRVCRHRFRQSAGGQRSGRLGRFGRRRRQRGGRAERRHRSGDRGAARW